MARKIKIKFQKESGFSDRLRGQDKDNPVLVEELIARLQQHPPKAVVQEGRGLLKIINDRAPANERLRFIGDESSD